ncbi:MAG: DUF922 domain-containing protein [Actinomycetota bacterium]
MRPSRRVRWAAGVAFAAILLSSCEPQSPREATRGSPSANPPPATAGQTSGGSRDSDLEPGLHISVGTSHYRVRGSSLSELRSGIARHGPGKFDAVTKWSTQYAFTSPPEADLCSAENVRVDLSVEFVLPKWSPFAGAPAALRSAWSDYSSALRRHESVHKRIAEAGARELLLALRDLGSLPCERLDQAAARIARRSVRQTNERQRHYDDLTNHGASQGVVL